MDGRMHWEQVYAAKSPLTVSWYAPHLEMSLRWIEEAAPGKDVAILDVGGGASTLVDDLWAAGYRRLSVMDIAEEALALARTRLGEAAQRIEWIAGDVLSAGLPERAFDVWHDRAVFHFLTEAGDRAAYRRQLQRALRPAGQAVIATFSPNGPERCSGLPVSRYDARRMEQEFGEEFKLVKSATVDHRTPRGGSQEFLYCRLERHGA